MKFISDDGKIVGTKEEVAEYEEKLRVAEEEKKKYVESLNAHWKEIQNTTEKLSKLISDYTKNSGDFVNITANSDGEIRVSKAETGKYNNDIHRLFKFFDI